MSHTNISAALSTRLGTLPSSPPVAYENAGYTPAEGTAYIAEHYLPAETSVVGLADDDSNDFTGVYQIDVRTPLDAYKAGGNDIADAVLSHFKRGTVMTYSGQSVVVQTASRAQGRPSGSWWFIPVSIIWRAFSGNV